MKCPVCDVALSISSREGVEIDFCPQCRGVWLDRGELDKIIERAATSFAPAAAAAAPTPTAPPTSGDDGRYRDDRSGDPRKRKRRSFLDDLFDFD